MIATLPPGPCPALPLRHRAVLPHRPAPCPGAHSSHVCGWTWQSKHVSVRMVIRLTEFLDLSVKEEMPSRPCPVWELWKKLVPWLSAVSGLLLPLPSGPIPLGTFWPSGAICTKLMPPSHTLGSKTPPVSITSHWSLFRTSLPRRPPNPTPGPLNRHGSSGAGPAPTLPTMATRDSLQPCTVPSIRGAPGGDEDWLTKHPVIPAFQRKGPLANTHSQSVHFIHKGPWATGLRPGHGL